VSAPLRQAVLAVTSVLALAVVCAVAWTPRPRAETPPAAAVQRAAAPAQPSPAATDRPDALPDRNVFEFVEPAPVAPAPPPLAPLMVPPPLAPSVTEPAASEPIRLVGFVKKGGALRAALSLDGSVSVLAVGDEAGGYSVLSVDEDAGVMVRTPDGSELLLPPPQP
jgi:ribonuclease E